MMLNKVSSLRDFYIKNGILTEDGFFHLCNVSSVYENVTLLLKDFDLSKIQLLYGNLVYQINRNEHFFGITCNGKIKIVTYNPALFMTEHRLIVVPKETFITLVNIIFKEKLTHLSLNTRTTGARKLIQFLHSKVNFLLIAFTLFVCITILLFSLFPRSSYNLLCFIIIIFFLITIILKSIFLFTGLLNYHDSNTTDINRTVALCNDLNDIFEIYTILVPLYKEKKSILNIISALSNLKYPAHLLDIKFVLEEDDIATLDEIKKYNSAQFDIIIVPYSQPQTKPKALNYATNFIRGDYVVIYDAEDVPESDQLLKALSMFRNDANCNIMQGILRYYNYTDNVLTSCFSIEYYHWFTFFVNGLYLQNVQIPLGGTTNHFRYPFLRKINLWDAYNVTEDLEISCLPECERIYFLNSVTYEWCTNKLSSWLKQRARWLKGYCITYLNYLVYYRRNPYNHMNLLSKIIFFHFVVGSTCISFLFGPLIILIFVILKMLFITRELYILTHCLEVLTVIYYITVSMTYFAYCSINATYSNTGVNYLRIIVSIILYPFYFLLHIVAMYIAIYELIKKPFYWNKTEHFIDS